MQLLRKKSAPACKATPSPPRAPSPAPQLPPLPAQVTPTHARRRSHSLAGPLPTPARSSSLPLAAPCPAGPSSAAAQPWRSREAWLALHQPPLPPPCSSRTHSLEHPAHAGPGWRARGGGGFFGADNAVHDVVRRRLVDDIDAHATDSALGSPVPSTSSPASPHLMPTSISAPALAHLIAPSDVTRATPPAIDVVCPTPTDEQLVTPTSLLPPLIPSNVRPLSRRSSFNTPSRGTTPVPWSQSRGSGRTTPRSVTPSSTPTPPKRTSSAANIRDSASQQGDLTSSPVPLMPAKMPAVAHPPSTADRYPALRRATFQVPAPETERRASLPATPNPSSQVISRKLSAPVRSPRPAQRTIAPAPTHSPPLRPTRPMPAVPVDAVSDDEPEVDSVIRFEPAPPALASLRSSAQSTQSSVQSIRSIRSAGSTYSSASTATPSVSPHTPVSHPADAWHSAASRGRLSASSASSTVKTPDEKHGEVDWRVSASKAGDRDGADPFVCRSWEAQPPVASRRKPNVLVKKSSGRRVERGGWI